MIERKYKEYIMKLGEFIMGILDKLKKKEKAVLQQDLSQTERPGSVFIIHLLMKEKCEIKLQKHVF